MLFDKKLLPYILFENYINILASEMASPGNRHCTSNIGALSIPIKNPKKIPHKETVLLAHMPTICCYE